MIESYGSLEAELAALRPVDASPELRQRIASHRDHITVRSSRRRFALAIGGGLTAACVLAVLVLSWGGKRTDFRPAAVLVGNSEEPDIPITTVPDDSATIALRPGLLGLPNGLERPRFSWPLDNTLTSMIGPDVLE
jgi:hypothetical protein